MHHFKKWHLQQANFDLLLAQNETYSLLHVFPKTNSAHFWPMSLASTLFQNTFSSSVFQLSPHLQKDASQKITKSIHLCNTIQKEPTYSHVLKNYPEPTAFLVFYLYKLLCFFLFLNFLCLILLQNTKNSLSYGLQFLIRPYHQREW